jgi:hypothetical protein
MDPVGVFLTCLTPGCPRYGKPMAVARFLVENDMCCKCPTCGFYRVESSSGYVQEAIEEM